jgi:hypothetical protein
VTLAPDDWPILDEGLLMAMIDRLLVVRIDARLTPKSFARYRHEWLRAVDARPPRAKVGAFYDIPTWVGLQAKQRREWADMLKSREKVLAATTTSMTLTTPSFIARGALRAIFWLAPPPYPHAVVDQRELAFSFHVSHLPGLDGAACAREYDDLVRKHVGTTHATGSASFR